MKYIFLKFFSKNLDQIISMFVKLDAALDQYIAKEEAKASQLDKTIADLLTQKKAVSEDVTKARNVQANIKKNILG